MARLRWKSLDKNIEKVKKAEDFFIRAQQIDWEEKQEILQQIPFIENLEKALNIVLDKASKRNKEIFEYCYGLNGKQIKLKSHIAKDFNLCYDSIMLIERKILREMKKDKKLLCFKDYF